MLFLVLACGPLLSFPAATIAASAQLHQVSAALWSAYVLPLGLSPALGRLLDQHLLIPSQTSAVQFAPQLGLLWLFWSLVFLVLLLLSQRLRRAA
jgi:hypothetical protein